MKAIHTEKAPAAIGPYSQAQIAGGFVFTSGQIPVIPESGEIAEGIEAQTHQVFKNIAEILKSAVSSMDKVVKTTVFIKNMDDFACINSIYNGYFTKPYPARSCVEVAKLPKGVLSECEVVAEA